MHVTEAVLEPLRKRYGDPAVLEWESEISEREHALATYDPKRMHDVTLFILNGDRLALIRKPQFEPGVWRPPGGGIKAGEDFEAGVRREALEETGLDVELQRYLVVAEASFRTRLTRCRGGRMSSWPRPPAKSSPRATGKKSPPRAGAPSPSSPARSARGS